MDARRLERRDLLGLSLAAGAASLASACASSSRAASGEHGEEDIGPAEDLMREHGVLNRVLLVYEECQHRLAYESAGPGIPPGLLVDAASLVQRFIHAYHEQLEEREVFPRLERAGRHADIVKVLREQHAAGRRVTERILSLCEKGVPVSQVELEELSSRIGSFVRMYRPHEAREDTVIFPAFHAMFSPREWDELGEQFEGREREVVGEEGFEHAVAKVLELEKALGIDDLARFTPPA
jgi:hemerythrin-like domain-containing protein